MPRSVVPKTLTILTLMLAVAACQSGSTETPQQAVQSIIRLYEERDFDALVRTRYAELSKAENEAQVEQLVERFRSRFAADEAVGQAVETYRTALAKTPDMSEDGTVATFPLDGHFVKLSRMADGRWGFHL